MLWHIIQTHEPNQYRIKMTSFCLSIASFFPSGGTPLTPFQSQLFLQKHQYQNIELLNTHY